MSPVLTPPTGGTFPAPAPAARQHFLAGLNWNGIALVALVCALIALRRTPLTKVFVLDDLLVIFVASFCKAMLVMLPNMVAVVATYNLVPRPPWLRYAAIALALLVANTAGVLALLAVETGRSMNFIATYGKPFQLVFRFDWPLYMIPGALVGIVFVFFRERDESEKAMQQAELDQARFEQQMDEARLQMLQAQIEPHFLFNTLANVRRLYQESPSTAESMLEHLLRYLAVALPQMRATDTTLGREATLIESYLNIQKIRMGRRLEFETDIPPYLRDVRVPPLMLLTLIENSIKHGLNPMREGGSIRVTAHVDGDLLLLRVADTGQGFTKSSGGGTGLANTRARLAAVYGPRAAFTLALNQPRGVSATIKIPYVAATAVLPMTAP